MRTPGERTSGAWTGGCVIHPDGGDETDRTAGNSYTATPHNTQGANSGQVLLQPYGEPVTDCRAQPSLESNINSSGTGKLNGKIYQRVGNERKPLKKLKSNSIPKMIGNEQRVYGIVKPSIDRNLQHYVEQQIELLTK